MLFRILYFVGVFLFMLVLSFNEFQPTQGINSKFEKARNLHLFKYMRALRRIIEFYSDYRNEIDINFYFGLFLANVNLKRALHDSHQVLPEELSINIREIIRKTEDLENFFFSMVKKSRSRYSKYNEILSLFANAPEWIVKLPKLHIAAETEDLPIEAVSYSDLDKSIWTSYIKKVDDINSWLPNPQQSDLCLASLSTANNLVKPTTYNGPKRKCRVLESCYEMLENGTDFGYALTHRLLFLQQAKFSRHCSIYSQQEDKRMREKFCSLAYQEVLYIVLHDFQIVDLLMEHVCLCALEGQARFLRRRWLEKILDFQTPFGCFSHNLRWKFEMPTPKSSTWKFVKGRDQDILGGICNGHTTALAAAILAAASRYLIEMYY